MLDQGVSPGSAGHNHIKHRRCGTPEISVCLQGFQQSPVSPIIPVHTQKQGGGASKCLRIPFAPAVVSVPLSNAGDSNRLEQDRTASQSVPYTNCNSALTKPSFIRVFVEYVGAPTFWSAAARRRFCG